MGAGHAAAVIRSARARAGLSQRGLSERAGVAQSTIARYAWGAVEPSFTAVDALVTACGIELRTVLAEPDEDHLRCAHGDRRRPPTPAR